MNPEETPLEPTPTEGTTTVEPSPSSETVELQLVNEKLDTIVTEITKEPTPEELAAQETSTQNSASYETTTLENSATELELLQQISDKLSTLETTSTEQHAQTLVQYDNEKQLLTEQTWTLVFAITLAIGFKSLTDNMTKW